MSLKDKMANAKEVDLFEDLTQEEKIEAIVEGRLQVAMIKELEKIKKEIQAEQITDGQVYNGEYFQMMP